MTRKELFDQIKTKESYLCVGLDTALDKIPSHLLKYKDPIFEFNKQIIDATKDYCVAYKPNIAFYEALGADGWNSLKKTIDYIPEHIFTIADAKRGDIGNTCAKYAEAFFEKFNFDAITVSPFMGGDSIVPFLEYEDKWVIVLALTSNKSSEKFLNLTVDGNIKLYEWVLHEYKKLGGPDKLMFVTGATYAEKLAKIRSIVPEHFFLVPGVGAQGGDIASVSEYGLNEQCGLLINAARKIIYAGDQADFAAKSREVAKSYQMEMAGFLNPAASAN